MSMKTLKELQKLGGFQGLRKISHSSNQITIVHNLESEFISNKYAHEWDFDIFLPKYGMNLQRPYVWTLLQQQELIWSMILGRSIPPSVVIYNEHKRYEVIDGKQRIITIKRFLNNEFPIIIDGEEVYYKDLDADTHYQISYRNSLDGEIYYSYDDAKITDDQKIALFNFYNFAGTPQEAEHRDRLIKIQNSL